MTEIKMSDRMEMVPIKDIKPYKRNPRNNTEAIPKPMKSELHPTMKPIELISNALMNSSESNDNIMDLFGGSGSTLIACEQTNRQCYMMELDPHYCDVIISRWEKLTGQQAVKVS